VASSSGESPRAEQPVEPAFAVVLAAGEGVRLRPHTAELPKALLRVGGTTLLECQLTSLAAVGVRKAVVVGGHRWRKVKALIDGARRSGRWGLDIDLVVNDDYRSTGTGGSLRLALANVGCADAHEIVVVEGDVLLHQMALERLIDRDNSHDVRVLASRLRLESSLISADTAGTVKRISHRSDLNADPMTSESGEDFYNLSCYRFTMSPAELVQLLDEVLNTTPAVNVERIINGLCAAGRVGLALVDPRRAIEVDTLADLEAARRYVALGEWYGPYAEAIPPDAGGVSR
jgi:choline kinase